MYFNQYVKHLIMIFEKDVQFETKIIYVHSHRESLMCFE